MPSSRAVGSALATIDTDATRALFPDWFERRSADGVMQPDDLAEIYWQIH